VAKSNRRKRQDRVKAGARRAEQARRRAKAEREQQAAERYRRLLDPLTSPADVAGILAAELPDSLAAGAMMQIRLSSGVPGEEIAQTARLMLASATGPPQIGTLAVAAWAAHVTGDEEAEHGYASELLSRADAVDDPELRLEVIRAASVRGHPGEACELIEPYLRGHPDDELAAGIYAEALAAAHAEAEPGERERAALARYGDRSGSEALREAIDAFLGRTEWGTTVRKWADAERSRLEAEYWQAAERDQFDALAVEVAVIYPVAGGSGTREADGAASGDGPVNTPLRAFAADPATPGELAARASEWDLHVRFGIWRVQEPETAPGVWCTELVSGMRRYAQFPAATLDGAASWSVPVALTNTDGEPMMLIDATVTVSGDLTERLSARSDFAEEEGSQDGQFVWWGDQVTGASDEPIVMHVHQDGSAHLLDSAEDTERLVLGRVTPDRDRVRVQVNSHRRLTKLLQILADIGAEPEVAEQAQSEPSLDFAWGPVPDGASPAREWEKARLEQSVAVLDFDSPRHAAARAAEGSTEEALRLEGLLRQLEYEAGLAAARGERPLDTEWLRTELGLTGPLSERLP